MPDQTTTTPPAEDVEHELDAAINDVRGAMMTLRAAGDHLRRAAAGLPEIPLSEGQGMRRVALVHGVASALHELDKALHASGADKD